MLFNIIDQRRVNEFNPIVDIVYCYFENANKSNDVDGNRVGGEYSGGDPIAGILRFYDDSSLAKQWEYSGSMWNSGVFISDAVDFCSNTKKNITMYIYDPGYVEENLQYLSSVHPLLPEKPIDITVFSTFTNNLW